MRERGRRFVLLLAAMIALIPLLSKGRVANLRDGDPPFLPFSSAGIKVRLEGNIPSSGVYAFGHKTTLADVIKLTEVHGRGVEAVYPDGLMPLSSGAIVSVMVSSAEHPEIVVKTMRARERMLLGIPLDPDRMDADDWGSLPGVGPAQAARIVSFRQKYGGFVPLERLQEVPGIGERKFGRIRKFF